MSLRNLMALGRRSHAGNDLVSAAALELLGDDFCESLKLLVEGADRGSLPHLLLLSLDTGFECGHLAVELVVVVLLHRAFACV